MKKLIIGAAILILIIVGASFAYDRFSEDYSPVQEIKTDNEKPEKPGSEKMEAPDFSVFDINGNEVKLSDFKGQPVIVNFWATWCGPCRSEMHAFESVYKKYGDKIEFLMVNLPDGETKEDISAFVKNGGYTFPVYIDSNNSAAFTYGVSSIPATLMIDREGFIVGARSGAMSEDELMQYAEGLLAL